MSDVNVCAIQVFVFVIQRLLAMSFRLADSSLNIFPHAPIVILNFTATSYFMYSNVS